MLVRPPSVLRWPAALDKAQDLLIVAVDTPETPIRDTARQLVRSVLREILGDVELISAPGQPLRLARSNSPTGISVSHETGLSLLAINFSGPVGIDLLRIPENLDWQKEMPALAAAYLGPKIARQIADLAPQGRLAHFAQAWAKHEARLKCQGLALEEWSCQLEEHLSPCCVAQLALPSAYVGAVAILKAVENPAA